jgi:hypothetical protein
VFLYGQCRGVVLKSWKRGVSMWSVSRNCLEELETGCFYVVSVEELS